MFPQILEEGGNIHYISFPPGKYGRNIKGSTILPRTIKEEFLEVRSNRTQRTRDHSSTDEAATTAANKVDDGKN